MTSVLGISCYYHDSAAALLVDGRISASAEEERFSRVKHDLGFPENAIKFCLSESGIKPSDIGLIVFYENPALKLDRIMVSGMENFPRSTGLLTAAARSYLADRYWVKRHIMRFLGCSADKIIFSEHHLSHACSAYFTSPFDETAILTVDGVGEWNTTTISSAKGNEIRKLSEVNYPHSLGLLYSAFTAFLGFEVNEGEYKVMGMAPYGRPTYLDQARKLIRFLPDGGFKIDLSYFSWEYSTQCLYTRKFIDLFGEPRSPDDVLDLDDGNTISERGQRYADIAASVQALIEEAMLHLARFAHDKTGLKNLCLAGGVALNSVANHRIIKETPFDDIFVQPAAGDSGGALGAALYGWHIHKGQNRKIESFNPYLGAGFDISYCMDYLDNQSVPYEMFPDEKILCKRVAVSLSENKVVGWCQGRTEWGPRALGNRSILANPAHQDMKKIINNKVKFREQFRPFAPAVLKEHLAEYFDTGTVKPAAGETFHTLYYMLEILPFKEEMRERFPAVVHVDGSGRVQAVSKKLNPRFWRLISEFGNLTGVPMLLNTSFNVKGEPIVNSVEDALDTFLRTDIDELVIDKIVVRK